MSDQTGATKACVLCGEDVAGKPRHKDASGRYFCAPCFARAKAYAAKKKAAARTVAADGADIDDRSGSLPIASDEPDLSSIHEESSGPIMLREQPLCAKCEHPIAPDAVICTHCGHNRVTGRGASTAVGREIDNGEAAEPTVLLKKGGACGKCGYDLSAIKSMRCPECGTLNRVSSKRDEYAEDSRRAARAAYLKPTIYALLGILAVAAIMAFRHATPLEWIVVGVVYTVMYLVGLVVYFLCSLSWIGFDEPFHLMALRLLAAFSITNVVATLVDPIPIFYIKWSMIVGVHAVALMSMMEIDYEDAWIVAALTLLARIAVAFTAFMLILQHAP